MMTAEAASRDAGYLGRRNTLSIRPWPQPRLRRYRYGPVEWLWRSLMYGKRQNGNRWP